METRIKEIENRLNSLTDPKMHEITSFLKETYGIEHEDAVIPVTHVSNSVLDLENQTSFSLILSHAGSMKLHIIKTVKEITGLGLKEAKNLVESTPSVIRQGLSKTDAEALQLRLNEFGATVEII